MFNKIADKSLLIISILSLFSVFFALIAQHKFDMQPCAWCILQRLIFILIGIVGLAFSFKKELQNLGYSVVSILSTAGMFAAIYQYFVAAKSFDCTTSLAEKVISTLHLDSLLPEVFGVFALCADSNPAVLGVPFVILSFLLFVLISNWASVMLIVNIKNKFKKID